MVISASAAHQDLHCQIYFTRTIGTTFLLRVAITYRIVTHVHYLIICIDQSKLSYYVNTVKYVLISTQIGLWLAILPHNTPFQSTQLWPTTRGLTATKQWLILNIFRNFLSYQWLYLFFRLVYVLLTFVVLNVIYLCLNGLNSVLYTI